MSQPKPVVFARLRTLKAELHSFDKTENLSQPLRLFHGSDRAKYKQNLIPLPGGLLDDPELCQPMIRPDALEDEFMIQFEQPEDEVMAIGGALDELESDEMYNLNLLQPTTDEPHTLMRIENLLSLGRDPSLHTTDSSSDEQIERGQYARDNNVTMEPSTIALSGLPTADEPITLSLYVTPEGEIVESDSPRLLSVEWFLVPLREVQLSSKFNDAIPGVTISSAAQRHLADRGVFKVDAGAKPVSRTMKTIAIGTSIDLPPVSVLQCLLVQFSLLRNKNIVKPVRQDPHLCLHLEASPEDADVFHAWLGLVNLSPTSLTRFLVPGDKTLLKGVFDLISLSRALKPTSLQGTALPTQCLPHDPLDDHLEPWLPGSIRGTETGFQVRLKAANKYKGTQVTLPTKSEIVFDIGWEQLTGICEPSHWKPKSDMPPGGDKRFREMMILGLTIGPGRTLYITNDSDTSMCSFQTSWAMLVTAMAVKSNRDLIRTSQEPVKIQLRNMVR